jgi:pyruvate/2-oxoglutarate dehydrogenase complex dihydrolipoamide dehydrogenase (E3) component
MNNKYDAVIIGFGKGGKTLAAYLGKQGKKVAMIERSEKMYGGTCINIGCIPTKSLVNSAEQAAAKELADFAAKADFYQKAFQERKRVVEMLRNKNYHMLADLQAVTIYHGVGSFVNDHDIKITAGSHEEIISGDKIFINTGSRGFVPPIPGIKGNKRVYISSDILEMAELPQELAIIGGGYIGLEFAAMFAKFGSHVTVIQDGPDFIPREDREIAAAVLAEMQKQGIDFVFSAAVKQIEDQGTQAVVHYEVEGGRCELPAQAVLVATGRRTNIEDLNLAAAGVEVTPRGGIVTDEQRRTTVPHIWAMGDVVGGLQFTYISLDDFRLVKASLEGGAYRDTGRNIAYSVFIEPTLSRIGLTEQEAIDKGYDVAVATLNAAAIPKAHVLRKPYGLLKAVVDKKTQRILGVTMFCADSHELINQVKLVMDYDLPYTVLRDQIFTHPTMSEAMNDLFGAVK